jgi:hypothetical protein
MLNVAAEYKKHIKIPVGAVTYMDPARAPDFFEKALQDGKVDYYLMNRPLTVDPEYVNKLRDGRVDEIAPCTRCLHCYQDFDQGGNLLECCRVNTTTCRANLKKDYYQGCIPEGYEPLPARGNKNVMVAGGGPSGMEAARIAAQRGYRVTLYEKNGCLGGLIPFASAIKGPHENLEDWRAWKAKMTFRLPASPLAGSDVQMLVRFDSAAKYLSTAGESPAHWTNRPFGDQGNMCKSCTPIVLQGGLSVDNVNV